MAAARCLGLLLLVTVPAWPVSGECTASNPDGTCTTSAAGLVLLQSKTKPSKVAAQEEPAHAEAEKTELLSAYWAEFGKPKVSFRNCAAEFLAMTLFVIIGCGSAMSIATEPGSAWVLQVALTFGLAITVLAYSIGHYSGGQINCAVTFGLVMSGHLGALQASLNVVAQMLGSIVGASILKVMYPGDKDRTGGLGTNSVAPGWKKYQALIGEFVGTFLLMFTVLETAVNPMSVQNRTVACIAIGFAVFLAHSVLIPVDGCSINPTRSLGPAVVESICNRKSAPWQDMWVFWLGPLAGAAAAAGVHKAMAA